ncbi:hypothetical protein V2J09_019397 [Rumex salicifolius]
MIPFVLFLLHPLGTSAITKSHLNAIYQFGDSLSDTGNAIIENPAICRCSDGRLLVDFVAQALELPLLNPYLRKNADFSHGVNFAVAGATALNTSVIAAMNNITVLGTNSSLSVQVGWFKTHLKSLCSFKQDILLNRRFDSINCISVQECKHRLRNALFLVGEIGGNDYGYALGAGKSIQDQFKIVPDVVHVTKTSRSDLVQQMIAHGAERIIVRGFFPIGCTPIAQVNFASNDTSKYDKLKCIIEVNKLSQFHNLKLQEAVKEPQIQHPSVRISYGDAYSAFIGILRNAVQLGFEKDGVSKTCCGDGNNAFNYKSSRVCGTVGVSACSDPTKRLSWNGLHLTQQTEANSKLSLSNAGTPVVVRSPTIIEGGGHHRSRDRCQFEVVGGLLLLGFSTQ